MKTKLGELIQRKQKANASVESFDVAPVRQNDRNPLRFYHCQSVNLVCQLPASSPQKKQEKAGLQLQNYRLIESNFKLVNELIHLVDFSKKYLEKAVVFLDAFRYLEATKTIYEMLKKIELYSARGKDLGMALESGISQTLEFEKYSGTKTTSFNPQSNADIPYRSPKKRPENRLSIGSVFNQQIRFEIRKRKESTQLKLFGQPMSNWEQMKMPEIAVDHPFFSQKHESEMSNHFSFTQEEPIPRYQYVNSEKSVMNQRRRRQPIRSNYTPPISEVYRMLLTQAFMVEDLMKE